MSIKILAVVKICLISVIKHETGGVAIEEFVGLTAKMPSFFVDENSEH